MEKGQVAGMTMLVVLLTAVIGVGIVDSVSQGTTEIIDYEQFQFNGDSWTCYGNWTPGYPSDPVPYDEGCDVFFDSDWDTYAWPANGGPRANATFTYLVPDNAQPNSFMKSIVGYEENNTIPTACWEYNESQIDFLFNAGDPSGDPIGDIDCWNGTAWENVFTFGGFGFALGTNTAMYWQIQEEVSQFYDEPVTQTVVDNIAVVAMLGVLGLAGVMWFKP